MYDARAAALATNGFAFFALPPDRPSGRRDESERAARRVLRAIRLGIARAADEQIPFLPRITNYPY